MEKLSDLRFIIGLFFGIAGAILLVLSFAIESGKIYGKSLNLYAGIAMMLVAAMMLWLSGRREG